LMMSLWDALRMNMMISYQELVRTFLKSMVQNHFAIQFVTIRL
ncbi:type 1 fimbrial protein, partial [Klebsiella pneumoniae subsp. pneumoniae]